ncbi:MAG: MerR family transcriptional regulator [Microbacterium sp.]
MKLQELAERSDTPTSTIKYYLREKLLEPGVKRNATTASYDQSHLDRLALIATLRQAIGLSIEQVRTVIDAVRADDPVSLMGVVQEAVLGIDEPQGAPAASRDGQVTSTEVIEAMGWSATASVACAQLDQHLDTLARWGIPSDLDTILAYARAADDVARFELNRPRTLSSDALTSAISPDRLATFVARGVYADSRLLPMLLAIAQGSYASTTPLS